MTIQITSTGKAFGLEVRHVETGELIPVVAIHIEPLREANGWQPQVTLVLPPQSVLLDLLAEEVILMVPHNAETKERL